MTKKRVQVVFASAEAAPFVKTGGLGDVAGSLPQALGQAGADVIVMVPKYGTIDACYADAMTHLCNFYVPLGWRNEYCGLERLELEGVTYLFIDNERYFKRDSPYGFFDDGERFAFFSKAIVESLQHLPEGFTCDVLHCNDWHTALAPVFLREFYQGLPTYEHVRTVFSIHNIAFQGQFSDRVLNDILGLAHIPAAARQLRCDASSVNYMQGALHYADSITTVSPTYAEEIRTTAFGERLDSVLRERSAVLSGILNGIDVEAFEPADDRRIAQTFSVGDMAGKRACKAALQKELGLEVREDRPLMIMVTRLTRQKGLDLVTYSLERILSGGVQVAILGTGDRTYEDALNFFASLYPGAMAARIQFNPALSHRMYAGADILLMPSLFEPCGLSQMIAMRYGTLPVVRETGGLKDTVTPYNRFTGEGTGFSFTHFNGDEMGDSVFRAARLFWDDRDAWRRLVAHAMDKDFSWVHSAGQYLNLYRSLFSEIDVAAMDPADTKSTDSGYDAAAADLAQAGSITGSPAAPASRTSTVAVATPEPVEPVLKPAAKRKGTRRAPRATTAPAAKGGAPASSASKRAATKRPAPAAKASALKPKRAATKPKARKQTPTSGGATTARAKAASAAKRSAPAPGTSATRHAEAARPASKPKTAAAPKRFVKPKPAAVEKPRPLAGDTPSSKTTSATEPAAPIASNTAHRSSPTPSAADGSHSAPPASRSGAKPSSAPSPAERRARRLR